MKPKFTRWMIAAAALAAAAGSASAQTYVAEIPLSFHVQNKLMGPGTYRFHVARAASTEVVEIYNSDTHTAGMLLPLRKGDAPKTWRDTGKPVVSFECNGGVCALNGLWDGTSEAAYGFPGLKLPPGEARTAQVTVPLVRADE